MRIDSLKFKGNGCFVSEWAGFKSVRSINVIIGRNNTGKSQLLELVKILCAGTSSTTQWEFKCEGFLDEQSLRGTFLQNYSHGDLPGNHWSNHGQQFVDVPVEWKIRKGGGAHSVKIVDGYVRPDGNMAAIELTPERALRLENVVSNAATPLQGLSFRHLLADRDVRPERPSTKLALMPDGSGATNIIRRLITSSSPDMPRELVQTVLRNALNEIFSSDGHFNEIQVQQHDHQGDEASTWEIFLGEERKGLVALSSSGSGLKTVILVLLHLLVIPKIEKASAENYVFCFEELENNLHPALLRRLLQFIESFAVSMGAVVFLTTHSSAALDMFGSSPNAQIVHVTHDGVSAAASDVDAHFSRLGVVSELGAKPSDLLQANGIVWVEGPSDAIHINKWIHLESGGSLREGRDYLCAFYGGALLARAQFMSPEEALGELVNLLMVNPNVAVVCDSDRRSSSSGLKPRVLRIREEVEKVPGSMIWVTEPKEIENYLSGEILSSALALKNVVRSPDRYESFFPVKGRSDSYCEQILGRAGVDKIELATLAAGVTTKDLLAGRFDWSKKISKLTEAIRSWNR